MKVLFQITNLNSKIAIQPTFSREFYNGDALVRASKASKKISSVGDMGNRNRLKQIISDSWHTELIPASQKLLTELERNAEFFSNYTSLISLLSCASSRVGFHLRQVSRGGNLTHKVSLNTHHHATYIFIT